MRHDQREPHQVETSAAKLGPGSRGDAGIDIGSAPVHERRQDFSLVVR